MSHTHTLTHTFTHKRFYTQTPLHTVAFTHRRFYTQTLLHTETFTHRSFYTHTFFFYTHTCSEMSYRITDVECIGRAKTTQLNLTGMVWWPNVYIYIYINIVTSQLRTTAPRDCQCSAQLRPPLKGLPSRATACRYVYTGPGGVVVGHRPPRDPGGPLQIIEVLHLFRWYTHTPRNSGADEMTMKMTWMWKWNEKYLTRTRRGERKRRGKEQTPTRHT